MKLRHPHNRLLVFDLLHKERIRCNEALVKAALACGLIQPSDSLDGPVIRADCRSLIAVDAIVKAYFEQHHPDMNPKEQAKLIRQTINLVNKDIRNYKLITGINHPTHIATTPVECGTLSPAVLDFLLQHLHHFD